MKLGFIGGGVMAEAIIAGIRDSGLDADIAVGDPIAARRDHLVDRYGVTATDSNSGAIEGAQLVVLAVKPQQFKQAASDIAERLSKDQTVLSIMAGIKMHSIGLALNHRSLVRVMPNTPSQVRQGMSVWVATDEVPDDVAEFTSSMLDGLGDQVRLDDEKVLDMATALSASGPAFVYVFLESLIDAGVQLGMPADIARRLALQTIRGSASLAMETGKHPAELRNMVTSPGGTTAAGLHAMEERGFRAAAAAAVLAAYQRGEELGTGKK